ncbi:hypothetical protein HYALB_00008911 [Hymenoscyphus albidus]|uniref:Uncharacterized protein n=1 Tax=Hymenoscyphus albidus TaxID=595503 RepID=A0A9N9LXB5_9HELO|nr:hypothetical protein HYALB_00008911 [Hymenoscyphus albidus]
MQFINFSTVVLLASALSVNALPTPAPEGGIAILATRTPLPAKPATWLSTRRDVESSDGLFSSTIDEANEALEKRAAPPPPTGVLAPVLKKIHGLRPKKGEEIQGLRGPHWFNKQNNVKGPVPFIQPLKKSSWWKPWTKLPKSSKRPVWINSARPPQSKPSVPYKPRFQKYNPFKNGMLGGTKAPKDATSVTPKDATPGTPKDTTPEPAPPRDAAAQPPPQ